MTDRELLELAASKREALERGARSYFTGKPCKRGHISARSMPTGVCVECRRITAKALYERDKEKRKPKHAQYRAQNKEKIAAYFKRYYKENKERRSDAYKLYRADNAEKESARHIRYRIENLEACKDRERRYREENKDKFRVKWQRRRARKANAQGSYTAKDIERIATLQRNCCANCRRKLRGFHVDHIEPLSRGGSNWPTNLQLLCPPCNLKKHAKTPERWSNEQGRLL